MSKKHITPVFTGSLIVSLILVLLGIIVPRGFQSWTQILREQVSTNFGWLYLLLVTSILALCVFFYYESSWTNTFRATSFTS